MGSTLPLIVAAVAVVSILLSPKATGEGAFFKGLSPGGKPPGVLTLTFSQVTTWIFARSLMNAAILGYYYGIWGTLAYAAYYLSFLTGARIIDSLRFEQGYPSVQAFLDDVAAVMGGFRYYRPHHTIQDIAQKAQEIVALTHQYGEQWLIAGEIGEFVKDGVQDVLCLQPFGCIANQVVAKGVAKRLKEKYSRLNLLFLDLDAGVSEVNYFNRLHFFINHAKSASS